jgi:hypothetical protein
MATAGELIVGGLRLIGVVAEAETPSAATMQDSLTAFNQLLESWSIERLAVYVTQTQIFTWPSGQAQQTLGPTGDFVGERPVTLDDSTYFVDPGNGLSFTVTVINEAQYNAIALKTATSSYPQMIWARNDYPDMQLSVFPVPTRALEWHFVSVKPLEGPATLATDLTFPPGYLRAFRYALACELAPEFGVEPSPTVQRIAMVSKRDLKRVNNPDDLMSMPRALIAKRRRFNIFSGGY